MGSFTRLSTGERIRYSEELRQKEMGGLRSLREAAAQEQAVQEPQLNMDRVQSIRTALPSGVDAMRIFSPQKVAADRRVNALQQLGDEDLTARTKALQEKLLAADYSASENPLLTVAQKEAAKQEAASIRKQMQEIEEEQERRKAAAYANLSSRPDYAQYSQMGAAMENPSFQDAEKGLRVFGKSLGGAQPKNIVTYSRENAELIGAAELNESRPVGRSLYRYMTGDEVNDYNYLLAKEGEKAAQGYLDTLEETLNYRAGTEYAQGVRDSKNPLLYAALSLGSGVESAGTGIRQAANAVLGDGKAVPTSMGEFAGRDVQSGLVDDDGKKGLGYYAFAAGNTVGNMLPSIAVGFLNPTAGLATMGAGAGGNAYGKAIREGYSREQAVTYGTLVGASEALLEKLLGGLSAFRTGTGLAERILAKVAKLDNMFVRVALSGLVSVGSEINEEELQNFLEPAFRTWIFGEEYEAPTADELLETAIVTALSTVAMEGPSTVSKEVNRSADIRSNKRTDAAIDNAYKAMEESGIFSKPASEARAEASAQLGERRVRDAINYLDANGIEPAEATETAGNTETPAAAESTAVEAAEAGTGQNKSGPAEYRAEKPQNIELPNVPIISLSMQTVADLNGGVLPEKGNYIKNAAYNDTVKRLGLDKSEAVYIEASNITRNGDSYVLKLTKPSINKMLSADSYSDRTVPLESIAVISQIERIAQNGVYLDSEGDRKSRPQVAGYDYLRTTVYIDGDPYLVNMRVRVDDEQAGGANRLYHFTPEAVEVVKTKDGAASTGGRHATIVHSTDAMPSSEAIVPQQTAESNTKKMDMTDWLIEDGRRARAAREGSVINEQETGTETAKAEATAVGDALPDGRTGRTGDERDGGRAVRVSEEVRQKGGGRAQQELAVQRADIAADQPLVSPETLGVPNGTANETMRILPEADWDEEVRQGVDWARSMGASDVQVVVGLMEVQMSGPEGTFTGRVLGAADDATGAVWVVADDPSQSFSESVEHEMVHLLADEASVRAFREAVMNGYRREGWLTIYNAYERAYAKLTSNYEGMTAQEKSLYIWEELMGDAFSKKNKFGVAASLYAAEAERALEGAKAGADKGKRYTVETTQDGEQITVIDQDQDIFKGQPVSRYAAIARQFLLDHFKGQTLPLGDADLARLTGKQAGEYAYPRTQYANTSLEYEGKMRAAVELDHVLETAEYDHWAEDAKNHPEATLGFDYYKTKFIVGGHLFEGVVNIANSENGRILYDITKIKEIPDTSGKYEPLLARSTSAFGNLSNDSISRDGQKSNPQKYSAEDTRTEEERRRDELTDIAFGFRHVTPIEETTGKPDPNTLFRPEGMSDEQYKALDERWKEHRTQMEAQTARTREQIMGRGQKEAFKGSKALRKLGIKVEGSVGVYENVESVLNNERAARDVRKQVKAAEIRLDPTEKEQYFASGIAEGTLTADDVPQSLDRDKVEELASYYAAEKTFSDRPLRRQRADIKAILGDEMRELFKDSEKTRPSGALVLNNRTPERNMLHIFGDEQGKAINDFIFDPVAANEAERYRWMTSMFDKVRTFTDSHGKKSELNKTERFLTQLALEGKSGETLLDGVEQAEEIKKAAEDIGHGMSPRKAAKKHSLDQRGRTLAVTLSQYAEAKKALDSGKADGVKVDRAVEAYREVYNDLYDAVNDFLAAHGYEPIGFTRNYAPHFQSQENLELFDKALQSMGVRADVGKLPASIAGLTADFKPGKRWDPHFLTRLGDVTEYDAAKGFEQYIDYVSDIFYHTDDIAKVREASNYFRETYAPENIRDSLRWARDLNGKSTEDKLRFLRDNGVISRTTALSEADVDAQMDAYIEQLYKNTKETAKFSDLVMYLDNYANILAGKQSMADRGWEYSSGRGVLTLGNRFIKTFARSNVAGNLSSALNQTAQLPQIVAELGPIRTAHAIADAAAGRLRKASWIQESDFLTGKDGVDFLVKTPDEMVLSAMFKPAELVDSLTSAVAVRAKYLQEIKAGKDHAAAMKSADAYAKSVMGSRMKGSKPLGFEAKNPVSQAVRVFQVEALNSWEHISQDLPRDFRAIARDKGADKAALALAGVIIKSLLAAFILNRFTEEIYGGTPAPFDLIGLSANFIASGEGLTTNAWLRKVIDDGAERLGWGRVFDSDPEAGNEEFDWSAAGEDTLYNVMNDVPFVRNLSGVLGLGDETLPMPDLYGKGKALSGAAMDDGILSPETRKAALDFAAEVIPGGRQISKTAQGIEAVLRGGKYKGYGEDARLQYPIGEGAAHAAKTILFGPNSTDEIKGFYAAGGKGLSAKQTGLYNSLVEQGADRFELYDAIQDWRKINGNDELTSLQKGKEERDLIRALNLTDGQKLELYKGLTNAESRAEQFQALMDKGLSWDQVMDAYDQYAEINADEEAKATEKATRLANWADKQGYTKEQSAAVKEQLRYWQMTPTEAANYEKISGAGLDPDTSAEVARVLGELEPMEGYSAVTAQQKALAVVGMDLSKKETDAAVKALLKGDQLDDYEAARAARLAPETYLTWKLQIAWDQSKDTPGDGKKDLTRQAQVVESIDALKISRRQKDALYLTEYTEANLGKTPWHN